MYEFFFSKKYTKQWVFELYMYVLVLIYCEIILWLQTAINALFTNDIKPLDDKIHMLSLTYTFTFNKCWIYTVTSLFYNQRNGDFWHMQY